MRVALWVIIIALVVLGRMSGDDRYIAAVAPLVVVVLWFAAPAALRSAVALIAVALLAAWYTGGDGLLVDVLPIAIAALVGWLFARSLLGGREPLIARAIAAIDGSEPLADPSVRRYAMRLTRVWAGCQFALAAFGLLCVAHFHWAWPAWTLPTPRQFALLLPLVVIGLFVTEFALRPALLPQAPRKQLFAFVRALAHAWPRLIEK